MSLNIFPISLGTITMDASGLVLFRRPGVTTTIPMLGFLITGGEGPILVDTGARDVSDFDAFGFRGEQSREMTIEHHLAQHGLTMSDLRYVIHTHAHVDHAGGTHRIPMSVPVAIARREL